MSVWSVCQLLISKTGLFVVLLLLPQEIARKAALDVVECIGNQDPTTSTLYLALYQVP